MATWRWANSSDYKRDDKCEGCKRLLREDCGAGIVYLTVPLLAYCGGTPDRLFHTHCAIDMLVTKI